MTIGNDYFYEIACPKHPTKPRRWKYVRATAPRRISVCSECCPARGGATCVNGHTARRRTAGGVLVCRICRRNTKRSCRRLRSGSMRGDPWARNVAAMEASR